MDLRLKLVTILDRVKLSAKELDLQPEAFQATGELKLAASDLAAVIAAIDTADPPARANSRARPGLAIARPYFSAAA
jgi:hypothetical protein